MKNGIKVVTIGGGSSYTPELVEGFIKRYHELPIRELWLVDIVEGKEKLAIVGDLAKRMVKKAGIPMQIHMSLNRREALKDADFVTTQFRVGQLDAREKDELIPLKYQVIGQETNGPGGLLKAFRTIPVLFDIIKDCEALCPNTWIISFTNPSGINAEAVFRHTNWKRFIGLCNGPVHMIKNIEAIVKKKESDIVEVKIAGLNHMIFALNIHINGMDITAPFINTMLEDKHTNTLSNITNLPWSDAFLQGFGYYGIDYLRYYLKKPQMLAECQASASRGCCRAQVVKKVEKELFDKYKDIHLDVKPKELEKRGGAYYSDAACDLICSIYNDKHDIQVVDTLNNGAITNLDNDVVVEVSSIITKDGPQPLVIGTLPPQCNGLIQQLKAFEIIATNAAVSGDYNQALVAMSINPLVQSEETGKLILDEMLEANKAYLPQFYKKQ